jgi:hypothetical protein
MAGYLAEGMRIAVSVNVLQRETPNISPSRVAPGIVLRGNNGTTTLTSSTRIVVMGIQGDK